jgi:hypothetical protein
VHSTAQRFDSPISCPHRPPHPSQVRDRLYATREALHHCLGHPHEALLEALERAGGAVDAGPLLADLRLLYRSLVDTGDVHIANSAVLNAIRQVRAATRCQSAGRCASADLSTAVCLERFPTQPGWQLTANSENSTHSEMTMAQTTQLGKGVQHV